MMQQPNVRRDLRIQAMVCFEIEEKILPFLAEAMGDVVPQPFYASVVHAPSVYQKINRYEF